PTELRKTSYLNDSFSSNWVTQGGTDHLFCAACPALVFARIMNCDRQIVAAPVVAVLRARRTLRPIVATGFPYWSYMFQDSKLFAVWIVRRQTNLWFGLIFGGHLKTFDKGGKLRLRQLLESLQIPQLLFD